MDEDEMRRIAREEVRNHEARFTVSGAVLAIAGILGWLVGTGQF